MCGIFGYVGKGNAVHTVIDGLKKLEYRGYDSSGIAGVQDGKLVTVKAVGKVANMEEQLEKFPMTSSVAISHTRWATHGRPTQENAHPHTNGSKQMALVHNGIIENHEPLKKVLTQKGVVFTSDTDTEVIVNLLADFYEDHPLKAVQQVLPLLQGSFAVCLLCQDFPDTLIAFANDAPLAVGKGQEGCYVSSDANAFGNRAKEVVYLGSNEVAVITAETVEIYDENLIRIDKQAEEYVHQIEEVSKGDFPHFTLKEIFEQPQAIKNVMFHRYTHEFGTALFEELRIEIHELLSVQRILILGCGSSYHAGYLASYLLQDLARIPTTCEIASEYRYANPIVLPGTFVIAMSQSGETADTIAAVRELKAKGAKVLSLVNVHGSTLSRESDGTLFLRAGAEIGVCSTKAFTNQVILLLLFILMMSRIRHMTKEEGQKFLEALENIPQLVQQVLDRSEEIESIAKKYVHYENFFFLGRRLMYPTALEGALKLKEISYINANGYPAGEMKHGPIALISEACPTMAFLASDDMFTKMLSNLEEVKARFGPVICIAKEGQKVPESVYDDMIRVPDTSDLFSPILSNVAAQLFAYYIARERGEDIDQPRNLAKSVTVE